MFSALALRFGRVALAASLVAAAVLTAAPQSARADYPERPIRLVVPYPAGGPNDVIARVIAEEGVPGYAMEAWYAVLAPNGTPKDIIDKLSSEIARAVNKPDVKEQFAEFGNEPVGSSAAEADAYIAQEAERWGKLLRAANIRAD